VSLPNLTVPRFRDPISRHTDWTSGGYLGDHSCCPDKVQDHSTTARSSCEVSVRHALYTNRLSQERGVEANVRGSNMGLPSCPRSLTQCLRCGAIGPHSATMAWALTRIRLRWIGANGVPSDGASCLGWLSRHGGVRVVAWHTAGTSGATAWLDRSWGCTHRARVLPGTSHRGQKDRWQSPAGRPGMPLERRVASSEGSGRWFSIARTVDPSLQALCGGGLCLGAFGS
jgi:hypothetical protein